MVDYSKWDKWAEDIDSSDDERRSKPTVTKFDRSQSVTFGGKARTISHSESTKGQIIEKTFDVGTIVEVLQEKVNGGDWDKAKIVSVNADGSYDVEYHDRSSEKRLDPTEVRLPKPSPAVQIKKATRPMITAGTSLALSANKSTKSASAPSAATAVLVPRTTNVKPVPTTTTQRKAEKRSTDEHTRNGGRTQRYHWAQTLDSVTCHVFAPTYTRGRHVRIAMDGKRLRVAVAAEDAKGPDKVLVDGLLCGSIRPPSDQNDIDWEINDLSVEGVKDLLIETPQIKITQRVVSLTMDKEPMGSGVIHWWKTVIRGDQEIDVISIPDRRGASLNTSSSERTQKLQDTWKIAHEQFRVKCKTRQKIEIDC